MKRTTAWLLILLLPALTLAACDRLSLSAATLGVGDCFQEPEGTTIEDVQRSPCTEPHTGEVIFSGEYPDAATYPTQADFEAWVTANCIDATFKAYTGMTYEEATDIELAAREILRMRTLLEEILAQHTGQPVDRIHQDTDRDFVMSAAEAKDYKLIDHVIDFMPSRAQTAGKSSDA